MSSEPRQTTLAKWSASIFSTRTLRSVVRNRVSPDLALTLADVRSAVTPEAASNGEILAGLFARLGTNYRNEYFYKNTVAQRLLVGRKVRASGGFLTEFRVGRSVVDCVLLNGTSIAYEIKTELDSPARLAKQVSDYRRLFPKVSVITHHSLVQRYIPIAEDLGIGVVSLTPRLALQTVLDPVPVECQLDVVASFKALRRAEYLEVVRLARGVEIDAPNTAVFRAALDEALHVDPKRFSEIALSVLAMRTSREPRLLVAPLLAPIRYLAVQMDLTSTNIRALEHWLESPPDVLPIPS